MSWLLFLDESGHDHRHCPYEVRGGIAIHVAQLWPLVQQLQAAERSAFGANLREYKKELKGAKLLDRDRFRWAAQGEPLPDDLRRKHVRAFLTKGLEKLPPTRNEFTAYGQACIELARRVFEILLERDARLFAAIVPRTISRPDTSEASEFLRKDHVFLLERFFYFLECNKDHGVLVFDTVDKGTDLRFVRQVERYFTKTQSGRDRTTRIVPVPMFVASDMSIAVQAADLAIYCVNWGFRQPALGLTEPARAEIVTEFGPWLERLQFRGKGCRDGRIFATNGIVFVPNPYGSGTGK